MLPQATKTKYTHPFIPHKNSRMQVEEEEHLPPSAISLNQPPAGPRNLLLNSAQPSLVRLHFYVDPYKTDRQTKRDPRGIQEWHRGGIQGN